MHSNVTCIQLVEQLDAAHGVGAVECGLAE